MSNNVKFKSKWFDKCIRDYLGLAIDEPITKEALNTIKYLYVSTTHDYELAFGKGDLPKGFYFEYVGEEWECCCVYNPGKYESLDDFTKVIDWDNGRKILTLRSEIVKALEEENELEELASEADMDKFHESVKMYYAESEDFDGLIEDEETCDWGILIPEDFANLTGLEVIRFMDCGTEIHRLAFIKELSNLKVLELGEVRLENMEGIEKILELDVICIWPEFYYFD